MTNQVQVFTNEEFGRLTVLEIDGKPYFPATECAKILGYSNAKDAIIRHCKGVVKHDLPSNSGMQRFNFIPEGDLYRLIIRSKLPSAERFEHWVMDEVLPTIRKHGAYLTDAILEEAVNSKEFAFELFKKLQSEKGKNAALLDKVEALAPKARYYDLILQNKDAIQVSLIAKDYGMSAIAFNKLLHELGIQYKIGTTWLLYQCFASKGYTYSKTYVTPSGCGLFHTCWTQKGRLFLYEALCTAGIYPIMERDLQEVWA